MQSSFKETAVRGMVRVGTSGWSYQHWRGRFYPAGLGQSEWLEHYATIFDTVELNNPFYRLPSRATFEGWANRVPREFLFAVKASRHITHVKKARDVAAPLDKMLASYDGLGGKLGPILFQFPPQWQLDLDRLRDLLDLLPPALSYTFEFRHPTWLIPETYALLEAHAAALCIADSPSYPKTIELTAPFAFVRMHGGRTLYGSEYSEDELESWAQTIGNFVTTGIDVFVYFNNDAEGFAVKNAQRLKALLAETPT